MNSNRNKPNHNKNIQALQELLRNNEDALVLKNDLIELLANYSRQLIQHYSEQTGKSICPDGDPDRQICGLVQIIGMLDAESEYPLFADSRLSFTPIDNTSSSAA